VALAPGAVGPGKRWATAHYAALARLLTMQDIDVWVVGGPNEGPLAQTIAAAAGSRVRDLTGPDLRNAILALAAADAAVTNDSGLMHVAAALATPTVALFGPTSPRLWAPLNPLAAAIEPSGDGPLTSRRIDDIPPAQVFEAVQQALAARA
jgi:heptosyltransferase-2